MVNLVLVGCGRMGSLHFKSIQNHPVAKCKYVVDIVDVDQFLRKHDATSTVLAASDLESVLKNDGDNIDGVVIASSSNMHYEQIKVCLQYNKPVFCEKPMASTVSEIDELYTLAQQKNLPPPFVGFQRRFDPSFQSAYAQIHEQNVLCSPDEKAQQLNASTVAGIEKIVSISRDPTYPSVDYISDSINCFYDSIIHDVDIICYMTKQFPSSVYCAAHAHFAPIKHVQDFDRMFVTLQFESGLLAMIDWCRHSGFSYDQRLNILGYNGMIEVTNDRDNLCVVHNNDGATLSKPKEYFLERYTNAYRNEIDEFVQIVQGKKTVKTTHEQMRNVMIVLAAIEKSARTGKPVNVDYDAHGRISSVAKSKL
eukprot:CAMPEP_0202695548 /NCGR_PEP_ID=MMETSP1385-20130828/9122_1 /ASSEMBLY_ACC=CAM_ASM_000861 /TAXON_ID=933848 /ORGANISM="Elphidium margaritaceum" /LENGTH=365 /DNA_ID=CAMNT_0049351597 /DNA_START=30 /DNA_END=1127 /DNA_ORIENTATION=+